MPRKTMTELLAEITSSFPDNTSGAITPAILRAFLNDFVETMTPAYGGLQILTNTVKNFGLANSLLDWSSTIVAQSPEFITNPSTGDIVRTAGPSTNRIIVNADVTLAANREITATLYKNGQPTTWRGSASGSGTGRPSVLSFEALDYSDVQAQYQIFCSCDAAGTAVTFANATFLVSVVPVRSAT